ncbi:MAG: KOW motif-containing protein [Woeseia sp.]
MRTIASTIAAVILFVPVAEPVAASADSNTRSMETERPLATTADERADQLVFHVGETVEITEGSFAGLTGVVKEIDKDKGTVMLEVDVFGRPTPVEVHYSQIKKKSG